MDLTSDHNAAGTRVRVRPAWVMVLVMFFASSFYRLYWTWRTNDDLRKFCRKGRPAVAGYEPINFNASVAPILLALSIVGWLCLWLGALPWGAAAFPEAEPFSTGARIAFACAGLALVIPGIIAILKTRKRICHARTMAGLPAHTKWTGRWMLPQLLGDVIGAPIWIFSLQHSLNDLWAHYPSLLDEDLFGELAPEGEREAKKLKRPELHQDRLENIASQLGDPFRVPWVTLAFLALCVGVWIFQLWYHGFFPDEKQLEAIGGFKKGGAWWKFFAANVLHGSVEHIVGNMFIWVVIGTVLERAVGMLRMLVMIGIGAVGCSVGALLVHPDEVGVGASGVVFAAFGMAAIIDPLARRSVGKFGWALSVIGICFSTFVPGISSGGHLGGLLAGVACGVVVVLFWKVKYSRPTPMRLTPVINRSAPLAPDRELSVAERLAHLNRKLAAGVLSQSQYDKLRDVLVRVG